MRHAQLLVHRDCPAVTPANFYVWGAMRVIRGRCAAPARLGQTQGRERLCSGELLHRRQAPCTSGNSLSPAPLHAKWYNAERSVVMKAAKLEQSVGRVMGGHTDNGTPSTSGQDHSDIQTVQLEDLKAACSRALAGEGYHPSDISTIVEVLLYAQLRGNNQGIIKLVTGGLRRNSAAQQPAVTHETRLSALLDGRDSPGMVVMRRALELGLQKAQQHGVAVVGTNHTSTGTGALGFWARALSEQGLVGIVMSQSPEFVAPHGSYQPIFGTNPIAVGIPAGGTPLVLDMATSAVAYYGLEEARAAGQPVAPDLGFDARGQPTTDPGAILDGGAVMSFDRSYKGSHLGLVVELLAGPLVGAAVADKADAHNWGNLLIGIDPALLGDAAGFRAGAAQLLQRVKGVARLPGVAEVTLPGERGDRLAAERLAAGSLPIPAATWRALQALAAASSQAAAASPPADATAHSPTQSSRHPAAAVSTASPAAVQQHLQQQNQQQQRRPAMATQLCHPAKATDDPYAAVAPPLYQTATFGQPSATTFGPYDYTRSGNPTRTMLESQMAALEGADRAFAFGSGMAALTAVCRLVGAGQHILAGDDIYGGTSRLLAQVVPGLGIDVSNVDTTDLSAVEAGIIQGRTKLVMLESPTNPRMQVCDIAAIAALAHAAGAVVCVDNSIMAPVFQRPLALGADISMTSATKFIGGHSDLTGGILSVKGAALADKIYFTQNAEGAILGPFDCWLALRGLKTMALRMERQAENCAAMAEWLTAQPLVRRVNYAGLASHPGATLHARQATSAGSLLSFETGDVEVSKVLVSETRLFNVVVSFGSVASSISLPCYMSHASIPAAVRAARGLPDDLVRISAGIEDIDDLIADLEQAMEKAAHQVKSKL